MLIDLHTHTRRFSWDSDLSPDELVDLSKHAGLDGICLTEHDFFWEEHDVLELGHRHDFLVLPAVEINTEDGHMLCYGLSSYVYGMHRAAQLSAHVETAGGVMVAAHPYRRRLQDGDSDGLYREAVARAAANPGYARCVALEQVNGRGSERENEFARQCREALGVAATAGSDAHTPADIGRCATEFEDRIECLQDLVRALRSGRCRPVALSMSVTHE